MNRNQNSSSVEIKKENRIPNLPAPGRPEERDKPAVPLQAVINSVSDVILVVDEDGRYREVLTGCRELLLMESEQLKGRLMEEVIPGADTRSFKPLVKSSFRPASNKAFLSAAAVIGSSL